MKTTTLRGVPRAMRRDGWWIDTFERRGSRDDQDLPRDMRKPLMLLALVALADAMVWQVVPGLSLAFFALCLVGAACLMAHSLSPQRAIAAGATTVLAVAPVVELVQPLSLVLCAFGLVLSFCIIAGVKLKDLFSAVRRYPWVATVFTCCDVVSTGKEIRQQRLPKHDLKQVVMNWAAPLGLGLVFLLLLVGANPILDHVFARIAEAEVPRPNAARIVFWASVSLPIWAGLIAHRLQQPLSVRHPHRHTVARAGLINAASVTRSLVLFNVLFFVQTALDGVFLYGASELPQGMTYATYAHRGAYPLLATALLAGAFAVVARPFTDDRPLLRRLMLLWLVQTLALVAASVTRLEIYVDVYGLTRLRVAAAIWMGMVGIGLVLVMWQVQQRHSTRWMIYRCALLGVASLYVVSFINVDATIAWYNLTRDVIADKTYLCSLSEGAIGPMTAYAGSPYSVCGLHAPDLFVPSDWREWGFRNWRLRSSLMSGMEVRYP